MGGSSFWRGIARRFGALPLAVFAALVIVVAWGVGDARPVAGGGGAVPTDWTSAVALINRAAPTPFEGQYCAGTLVRTDWVLTAAHCAVGQDGKTARDPASIVVAAGVTDLSAVQPSQLYDVDRVDVYPLYDGDAYEYDLALLHITRSVPGVEPARIGMGWYATSPYTSSAWLAGWGDTAGGFPNILQEGQVSVSSRAVCGSIFGVSGIICGTLPGSLEPSACAGDSGGPLMNFRYGVEVIGIVSFGPRNCGAGTTTAYTDVGSFHSWIAWVSRGNDASVSQPEINAYTARDMGRAIRLTASWCQSGGGTRRVRIDYLLFRGAIWSPGRRWDPVITQRGKTSFECTRATFDAPDRYQNGRWKVQVKITDLTTGLQSITDFPRTMVVRDP